MQSTFGIWVRLGLVAVLLATATWPRVAAQAAASEQPSSARIALVVGNAAYPSAPLKNPLNDARAVARALKELGFEVILQENLSQPGFVAALRSFGNRLKDTGGTGLFYYAGHGMQVKGSNYLIPVEAGIESEDEIRYMAIALRIGARTAGVWVAGGIRSSLLLTYWYSDSERRVVKVSRRQISNATGLNDEDILELERRESPVLSGGEPSRTMETTHKQ